MQVDRFQGGAPLRVRQHARALQGIGVGPGGLPELEGATLTNPTLIGVSKAARIHNHGCQARRIAALAMLTVLGLLVSSVIQRQVRLDLRTHDQQLPGNKGLTAIPTAAVVLALFSQVVLVQLWIDDQEVTQLSGVHPYHLWVCDALGLDASWYAVPSAQKNGRDIQTP